MLRVTMAVACTLVLLWASLAQGAAVPQKINYQAVLLDDAGDPVTDPVNLTFSIYDVDVGGTPLWTQTISGVDPDANGQFSVTLGEDMNWITHDVLTGGQLWLGIQVQGDAQEMSPRTELVSSAYSFRVNTVDQAEAGTIYGPLTIEESLSKAADAQVIVTCSAKSPYAVKISPCDGTVLQAIDNTDVLGEWGMLAPGQTYIGMTDYSAKAQGAAIKIRPPSVDLADVFTIQTSTGDPTFNLQSDPDAGAQISFYTPNLARASAEKTRIGNLGLSFFGADESEELLMVEEETPGVVSITGTDYSAKAAGASLKIRPPTSASNEVFTVSTSTGDPSFQLQTDPSGVSSIAFENPAAKISDRLLINNDGIFFLNAAKSETLMTITAAGNVHGKGQISMGANAVASEYTTTLGPFNQALNETCVVIGVHNQASDYAAAVMSGLYNTSAGRASAIGGGSGNETQMTCSAIAGGLNNKTAGEYNAVGGGYGNTAGLVAKGPGADPKLDAGATVGGGLGNTASGAEATVSGGHTNTASQAYCVVGGGNNNTASNLGDVVAGGSTNTASGGFSAVGGGAENNASGNYSVVAGGSDNIAGNRYSTVGGGKYGRAGGQFSTVGGGGGDDSVSANKALGHYSTVPGGRANVATGSNSFAAGRRAKADHDGVFIWGDNTDSDFASTATNQFLVRAGNGVGINVNNPSEDLDVNGNARLRGIPSTVTVYNTVMADGNGKLWTLSAKSSRRYKENIRDLGVDPANVLQLDPVRFSWKETGQEDMGLIAEEVAKLIPELAIYDEENRPDGVKYDKVVLYLLAALKDMKAENDALKAHQTSTDARLGQLTELVEILLAKQNDAKSGDDKLATNR